MFYRWALVALIGTVFIFTNEAMPGTGTWQVSASSDDCHAWSGGLYLTNVTIMAGNTSGAINSGCRFLSIDITQGATIESAYLKLCCETCQGSGWLTCIKGEDTANAATFSDYSDFTSRLRTAAKVDWDPVSWGATGSWINSPDIKTVIQEIVNRSDWQSGNAMVIFWGDDGTPSSGSNDVRARSWDRAKGPYPPQLEVTWTPTGVKESSNLKPQNSKLEVYPNPFVQSTVISYQLPVKIEARGMKQEARLTIYDLTGRLVKSFPINQSTNQLIRSVTWDGKSGSGKLLPCGLYFCKLQVNDVSITKQMILLR